MLETWLMVNTASLGFRMSSANMFFLNNVEDTSSIYIRAGVHSVLKLRYIDMHS